MSKKFFFCLISVSNAIYSQIILYFILEPEKTKKKSYVKQQICKVNPASLNPVDMQM